MPDRTVVLTDYESLELEQLLLDVVYDPDADESDRDIDALFDILDKVERANGKESE